MRSSIEGEEAERIGVVYVAAKCVCLLSCKGMGP